MAISSVLLVVILALNVLPLAAQPPQPPGVVILSEPIRLHVDPLNITADGVATSTITADVVWPEGWGALLSGTPACLVNVSFYTNLGTITPYNTTMPTPDNQSCTTIAILTAGTAAGTATIIAWADIAPPEQMNALVRNTTTVTFFAPGTLPTSTPTATPSSGGGSGGDGGGTTTLTPSPTVSPTATAPVTSTPTPTAGMTATPSPTAGHTATPSGTPTATPGATATPSPSKKPLIPGFEAVVAITGLLTLAYLLMWRRYE